MRGSHCEVSAIFFILRTLQFPIFAFGEGFLGKMALFVDCLGTTNLRQVGFEKICTSNLALYKTCDMWGIGFSKFQKRYKILILD